MAEAGEVAAGEVEVAREVAAGEVEVAREVAAGEVEVAREVAGEVVVEVAGEVAGEAEAEASRSKHILSLLQLTAAEAGAEVASAKASFRGRLTLWSTLCVLCL
jgi:hypothetical protein